MKELLTKTISGRIWTPCYVVNDWDSLGYFIGTNYQQSSYGTHSITGQVDFQIQLPFSADVLFPNESISHMLIHKVLVDRSYSDHGHTHNIKTHEYVAHLSLDFPNETGIKIIDMDISELMFDLEEVKREYET